MPYAASDAQQVATKHLTMTTTITTTTLTMTTTST